MSIIHLLFVKEHDYHCPIMPLSEVTRGSDEVMTLGIGGDIL